jgi:hypothetical protein
MAGSESRNSGQAATTMRTGDELAGSTVAMLQQEKHASCLPTSAGCGEIAGSTGGTGRVPAAAGPCSERSPTAVGALQDTTAGQEEVET